MQRGFETDPSVINPRLPVIVLGLTNRVQTLGANLTKEKIVVLRLCIDRVIQLLILMMMMIMIMIINYNK